MKKLGLLFIIMIAFLILPFSVLADKDSSSNSEIENVEESNEETDSSENDEEDRKEVNVYFFHGDGCPHCADAEEFFDSIEEDYGHLFELVSYETWYNSDNAALLEQVAEVRGEDISGVPYILIGNKAWSGYASDYNDAIIETIEEEYETDASDRYDIMELIDIDTDDEEVEEKDYSNDIMTLIVILILVGGVVAGVFFARKKTA